MKSTIGTLGRLAVVGLAMLATASSASAWINPKFTPRDLINQAETALVLEIKSMDANSGLVVATVQGVLKADANKPAVKEVRIDMLAMGEALSAQGKEVMSWIADGQKQALVFSGIFDTGGASGPGGEQYQAEEGRSRGFLNLNGKWVILDEGAKGVWDMQKIEDFLLGTWAGSTDMFLKCLNCVIADEQFPVPVSAGVEWEPAGIARIGKVAGKAHSAIAVDVAGKGQADLFVAADSGDRIFRFDGKTMVDVTAKHALASKSQLAAWADYDGDGRLDLLSFDGKAFTLLTQKEDGAFSGKPLAIDIKDGALSLSSLDVGAGAKAGVLVGTKSWPVLLSPQADGFAAKPLGSGEFPGKDLGAPSVCLVADFDGDGIVDVIQVFADAGLFYKGASPGAFAAPVRNYVGFGKGSHGCCLADFDGDGLQDVFICGEERNYLYQSLGGGQFINMVHKTGSLEYISKPGGIAAASGDFNNDGRQDLMIVYGTNRMATHHFFNRGFRCFGLARESLDLAEQKGMLEQVDPTLFPEASEVQQAGCMADFNGDGALDTVLVLAGVCQMPKAAGKAIAAGSKAYWDEENKAVVSDAAGNKLLGVAEAAAEADDITVSIRLDGGNVVYLPRKARREAPPLGAVVSVSLGGTPGPATVIATKEGFRLGAWVVRAGEPGVVIGTPSAGPIQLKWLLPDGKEGQKRVKVTEGPVKVNIGGKE